MKSTDVNFRDLQMREIKMRLFKTGLPNFDNFLGGGFVPGSVVTVCGNPGSGKSSLLTHYALQFAEQGANVVFYSTSKRRSILHAVAAGAWVDKKQIATMTGLTENEFPRIAAFLRSFAGNPGDISFRSPVPPRMYSNVGDVSEPDVVIFDVPTVPVSILEIMAVAGKLVICACDTTEYKRADPRPRLSDLPAAIVSASDLIIATHGESSCDYYDRKLEMIVMKGRDTGTAGHLVAGIRAAYGCIFHLLVDGEEMVTTASEKRKLDSSKQFVRDAVALFDGPETAPAQTVCTKLKLVTQPDLES